MNLLPDDIRATLVANAAASAADQRFDPCPVLKLFSPLGAATWLATELSGDGDTLFGLADLGFGCPELGYFSLGEIAGLRLPFGLRIERERWFASDVPLSRWTAAARAGGSLQVAEAWLRQQAHKPDPAEATASNDDRSSPGDSDQLPPNQGG